MPSLLDCLHQTPLAVVDVETTGASARWGDRIIEIGIVRYEGGQPVARYGALVDPRRRISPGVTALTGISQAMVEGQPTFAQRLHDEILPLMRGAVIVGHNVRFDLGFLAAEFRRARTPMTEALSAPAAPHVLDTVRIARRRFGRGGNALQRLTRRLGIIPTVAHRALPDAEVTGLLLERLLEPAGGFGCTLVDALAAQGGSMKLELERLGISDELPLEIEEAIDEGAPVRLTYLDTQSRRTERTILPLRVRRRRGTAMLIAHCELRNDQRTFKLDRIVSVARLDADPAPEAPPEGNPVSTPND